MAGGHTEGFGVWRKVASRVAGTLAKMVLPSVRKVKDPLSGYFALKKEVVCGVDLHPIGYKILLEVLALGHYHRIAEVPYTFVEDKKELPI